MSLSVESESALAAAAPKSQLVQLKHGRASVAVMRDQWFIAAMSSELKSKPLATKLYGTPLVLFRDKEGKAGALVDRCPHRNVPLSLGQVTDDGNLRCPYHGWQFDRAGACKHIPSLASESEAKARRALSLPTIEQQGFIWVYASTEPDCVPNKKPHEFGLLGKAGYSTVTQVVEAKGTMFSTIENALDVPHTAFLHRGLFRSESRGLHITAKVQRSKDRVIAEYVGEPRPTGLIARILSPSGGIVTHFDRFIMPSVAQVEYSIGTENHFIADSIATPLDDFHTRIYAVVSFRSRLPHFLIRPFVKPLALRVFNQDAIILERQTELIEAFGGEQFASTEIDVLGKHIWRLMRTAERGGEALVEDEANEVTLIV